MSVDICVAVQSGRAVGVTVRTNPSNPGISSCISGQVRASSIKKISEVVSSHPDESVAIIRSWLAEEPSDRAA